MESPNSPRFATFARRGALVVVGLGMALVVHRMRSPRNEIVDSTRAPDETPTRAMGAFLVTPVGLGGGGAMMEPRISPADAMKRAVLSDMGGVFVSRDGGRHWELVDGHELRSVACEGCPGSAVAFDPKDARRLFVFGRGRAGVGLHVSTDDGATFTRTADGLAEGEVATAMVFDTGVASRAFVATTRGLLVTEEGKTFRRVPSPGDGVIGVAALRSTILAATRTTLFGSSDGGASFERLESDLTDPRGGAGDKVVAALAGAGDFVAAIRASADGTSTELVASKDGGHTFRRVDTFGPRRAKGRLAHLAVVASPDGRTHLWVADFAEEDPEEGDTLAWSSADGGASWTRAFIAAPERKFGATHEGRPGWLPGTFGFEWGGSLRGLGVNPAEPSRAIVSTLGELVEGPFGDPTRWDAAYTIAVDDAKRGQGSRWVSNGLEVTTVNRYAVDPLDTRRHFVAYADIGLAKSTDGGRSFRHVLGPEIRWRSNVYDVAFDPSMKGRMWVAAARQHDIPHWTQLRGVAAGTSGRGGVLRSIDGGDHFVSASTGLPDAPAVSLALHEAAPGRSTMWVALWGSGIFRSTDGQTWEAPKPGLDLRENGNVTRVAAASDGSLYASVTAKRGDGGLVHPGAVFRSTDRGANWAKCALEGAKLAFVRYVAVDPEDPTHVVVTAVDRDGAPGGVFESRDACRSGTLVRPASLANGKDVEFFDAGFDGSSRDVWVTTEEHGTFVGHDGFASLAEWSLPFLSTQRVEPGRGTAPGTRFVATFGGGALRVDLAATQATP